MRDLKYILKRILIGVGIVICLSCINRCKVSALQKYYEFKDYHNQFNLSDISSDYNLIINYDYINVYKNINNNDIAFCYNDKCLNYKISELNFDYKNVGFILNVADRNLPNSNQNRVSSLILCENELPKINRIYNYSPYFNYTDSCLYMTPYPYYNNNSLSGVTNVSGYIYKISNENDLYKNGFIYNFNSLNSNNYKNNGFFSNINWNYYQDYYVDNDNIINIGGIPDFVSFHAIPNLFQNVITSYNIKPEFSVFDNDTYKYQYSFDSKRWLGLNENKQLLKINNNTTIYVRILKRENDEYINGATLTISQIGTFFYDDLDYNVKISGEYRTRNFLNNNLSSKSQSKIEEYQIYTDFYPNSSILKYQYQWVPNDSEFSEDKWVDIPKLETNNNQFGDFTYVVSKNGVFYARILDKDNNYLASATFTVNSIGKLALDNNQESVDNFLTKLGSKIDFGGPVGSLFLVPVNLLNSIYTPMSNSNTCSNLELGSLLGTNLHLPCVNVRRYLGSNVYNIIDLIMSFFLILGIIKMSIKLYNKFISMRDISS